MLVVCSWGVWTPYCYERCAETWSQRDHCFNRVISIPEREASYSAVILVGNLGNRAALVESYIVPQFIHPYRIHYAPDTVLRDKLIIINIFLLLRICSLVRVQCAESGQLLFDRVQCPV